MSGHRVGWKLAAGAMVMFAACQRPLPGPAATTAVVPDAPPRPTPPPPVACPLMPVALVVTPDGAEARTVLALDAQGQLDVSMFTHRSRAATLDTQGCLAGSDGLWAEWTSGEKVWTPHETLAVAGNCITVAEGRTLCVDAAGKVELRTDDPADVRAMGAMQIRGYRAEARCAGFVLLATFMSMTPSMAEVDGHPASAPVPVGSRCMAYRRP
jgi:hypothetical protein